MTRDNVQQLNAISNVKEITVSIPNNTINIPVDRNKFKVPEVVAVIRPAHPGEPAIMVKTVKTSNTPSVSTSLKKDSETKV